MYVRGQPPLQESSCQDTNGQSSAHGSVICRWLSYPAKWLSCSGRVALVDRAVCSKGTIFTARQQDKEFITTTKYLKEMRRMEKDTLIKLFDT